MLILAEATCFCVTKEICAQTDRQTGGVETNWKCSCGVKTAESVAQKFCTSGCCMVLRYTLTWDFIYARKKSAAFRTPLFMKLTNAQQQNVQMPYTEFQSYRSINAGNTDGNSLALKERWGLRCGDCLETRHGPVTFCGHPLYRHFRSVINEDMRSKIVCTSVNKVCPSPYACS